MVDSFAPASDQFVAIQPTPNVFFFLSVFGRLSPFFFYFSDLSIRLFGFIVVYIYKRKIARVLSFLPPLKELIETQGFVM